MFYNILHELLYGGDLKKSVINVEITCTSKNSILFLTPYFNEF